jgi:hypothetical protein
MIDYKTCPKGPHSKAEWLKRAASWDFCYHCHHWHYIYTTRGNKPKPKPRAKVKKVTDV